jgi:hypothetical protein
VLARAVLNLETADDPAARKELYERARRFVVAELRKQNPQISAQGIRREQAALEAAVRRIEAEITFSLFCHRFGSSVAKAFRTFDWEIPNCRAILAGVMPALKAARTTFI